MNVVCVCVFVCVCVCLCVCVCVCVCAHNILMLTTVITHHHLYTSPTSAQPHPSTQPHPTTHHHMVSQVCQPLSQEPPCPHYDRQCQWQTATKQQCRIILNTVAQSSLNCQPVIAPRAVCNSLQLCDNPVSCRYCEQTVGYWVTRFGDALHGTGMLWCVCVLCVMERVCGTGCICVNVCVIIQTILFHSIC